MFACETDSYGDDSYGRTNSDIKRNRAEANRQDGHRLANENRMMRGLIFDHIIMYRRDYLFDNAIMHYDVPGYGSQDAAFRFMALIKGRISFSARVLYERRRDIINIRLTDRVKALDVCGEFYFLKKKLKEDDKLWQKCRFIFWQSYYDSNMDYYEKLDGDIRPVLSKRMQADIREAVQRGEYSREHFDITVRSEMELLMRSTDEFDRFQLDKQRERKRARDKAGRSTVLSDSHLTEQRIEDELDRRSRECIERIEATQRANQLNRKWLTEEMGRDLMPLRMLLGLTCDEMGVMLGISENAYKGLESGKKAVSWDQYLALLFLFHYNDRTSGVIDTLGLYPEPLKIRFKKGLAQIYG